MSRQMKPRVLLVDDNPHDIKFAQFAAKKSGRIDDLKTFLDSSVALDFLRSQQSWRPHLILTDLHMPKVDGLEFLRQIKADDSLKHIPVVVLSSSSSPRDIKEAYGLHANSFITKAADFPEYSEIWSGIENYWLRLAQSPTDEP